jgi:hypothetical protein
LLSPAQRALRSRAAAHALHAQGGTSTTAGTAAFLARFERQVDPDGSLPAEERARRAEHALKAHMAGLALRASRARSNARRCRQVAAARAAGRDDIADLFERAGERLDRDEGES